MRSTVGTLRGAATAAVTFASTSLFTLADAAGMGSGEMGLGGAGAAMMGRTAPLAQPLSVKLSSKTFSASTTWSGSNFFDGWSFFNYADPTNGMVNYLGAGDAWNAGVVSISDSGTAIMQVDSTSWLSSGAYRNSVRITSNTPFTKGDLLVLDAKHMPYGCGTWPAFWTVGANWPYGGEIDIIEGVNNQGNNQMTLHTAPGCEISKTSAFAGSVLQESCDAFYNYNTGCGIKDPSTKSYGKKYNAQGGGVHATLWDDDGIYVWFFARDNIPSDLSSGSPKPSTWGKPRAYFSTDNCAMDDFFGDQTIVFDITLCGDWAGATYSSQGCPGTCAERVTNPNNFLQAYWEINYVKIFS